MTSKVTDDMLMAFVDGELDPAAAQDIRDATRRDPALARRADDFRRARELTREAFSGVLAEAVPDRLVAAATGASNSSNVVPLRRRPLVRQVLPLAASVALLFGAGGYWLGQSGSPGEGILGNAAVAQIVGETMSGETRPLAAGSIETLASYRVEGGFCRTFRVTAPGENRSSRGVACNRGDGWRIEIAVAAPRGDAYAPASSGELAAIDGFLDALGAGDALGRDEEKTALGRR